MPEGIEPLACVLAVGDGRDIGNAVVRRLTAAGLVDAVHDLVFAFVFHAFKTGGVIHK